MPADWLLINVIRVKVIIPVLLAVFGLLFEPFPAVSQAPVSSPTPEITKNEADLIHFGDLIDVDFSGTTEYDWRGSLKEDGMLDGIDKYAPVSAVCRTEREVAAEIANAFSKILRDPKVTVRIIDRSNRAVAQLAGAVKIPMRFRFQRSARLGELIVAAGGFTDDASGEITVIRPDNLNCVDRGSEEKSGSGNGIKTLNISINELLSGRETGNPVILSGDLITVQKAVPIYVIGAVNNPKPIYARSGMSVSRAIATAGGLAKGAVEQKVTIFRREGQNTTVMHIDLQKIKNGEINDIELKAFDIIEVTFQGRAQRKYPPVISGGSNGNRNSTDLPLRIIE